MQRNGHAPRLGALLAGLLAAALATALAAAQPTEAPATSFRLEGAGAGCSYVTTGALACRGSLPGPALVLGPTGDPKPSATAVVLWTEATPVLAEGGTWRRDRIVCRVRDAAITCTNGSGSMISVTADGVAAALPPAVAGRG